MCFASNLTLVHMRHKYTKGFPLQFLVLWCKVYNIFFFLPPRAAVRRTTYTSGRKGTAHLYSHAAIIICLTFVKARGEDENPRIFEKYLKRILRLFQYPVVFHNSITIWLLRRCYSAVQDEGGKACGSIFIFMFFPSTNFFKIEVFD